MSQAKQAATQRAKVNNWADDVLDRGAVAVDFTTIIKSLKTPHVVGINAGYGMGKTFFVDRWCKDLKDSGHAVLFFNAWENDFSDDPLMAFVVDLQEQVASMGMKKAESAIQGVLESAGRIGFQAMKSAAEAAALGLVNLDDINNAEKAEDFKKAYGAFAQEKVRAHLDVREGIKGFKQGLSGIASAIKDKSGDGALPVIVFIDELDRCRPDFAVQLLENIKHIFSVEDFIFVLSMDRSQMKHAVGVIYGHGMDGEGYLRRFIDLELHLPAPKTANFCNFLIQSSGLPNVYKSSSNTLYSSNVLRDVFSEYSDFFGLTLRDQEQVFREIEVSIRRLTGGPYFPHLMGFLAPLKAKHKKIYDQAGVSLTDPWELLKQIESSVGKQGYHVNRFDRKGSHKAMEFLFAALESDITSIRDKLQSSHEQKDHLTKTNQHVPPELQRNCKIYEMVDKISRGLSENYNFYEDGIPPILYVKQILDVGSVYAR